MGVDASHGRSRVLREIQYEAGQTQQSPATAQASKPIVRIHQLSSRLSDLRLSEVGRILNRAALSIQQKIQEWFLRIDKGQTSMQRYLMSQQGKHFEEAAEALAEANHTCVREKKGCNDISISSWFSRLTTASGISRSANLPILERKWTAVPRLHRKVLELEKASGNNAKLYAHCGNGSSRGGGSMNGTTPAVLILLE